MTAADKPPPVPPVPRATVRIQFTSAFGFRHATELVPYLTALGASHLYASPFLQARPGSSHGYDIVDHASFNPELGTEADFMALSDALAARGMGLILDFVPNHMGVGSDNPWWLDVLEWGEFSPYADFFDINWEAAADGRLLLPVLGDQYGRVLERGELALSLEAGALFLRYFDHRFPVAVRDYSWLLRLAWERLEPGEARARLEEIATGFAGLGANSKSVQKQALIRRRADELKRGIATLVDDAPAVAEAIAAVLERLGGTTGRPDSFRELDALIERQAYRIAFWRVAADEINYRRFFDVNELAGLRMERPDLFELTHALVFRLIGQGRLQGLRIDHIDGLFDPRGYLEQLQTRAAYLLDRAPAPVTDAGTPRLDQPFLLLVEKILAAHERLREDWPVAGTTGYEAMVLLTGLFIDSAAETRMTEIYEGFLGRPAPTAEMALAAKRLILARNLSAEVNVLAREMHGLARRGWMTRDHTLTGIRRALSEVVAHFPVYRSYVTQAGASDEDRRDIDRAVAGAKRAAEAAVDLSVYDFIKDVLTADLARDPAFADNPAEVVRVAMRAQQLTGPTMAKSIEDTLFYRQVRLVALNEVGGDPDRFGVSAATFHKANAERRRRWPHQLVATATHDHKRGADTRLRIAALSEAPERWAEAVRRWDRLNRLKRREIDGRPAPGRNDEYLLYQTLVGAWPLDLRPDDEAGVAAFRARIRDYMLKAVRESKYRSNWAQPDTAYEDGLLGFVDSVMDPERASPFLAELAALVESLAPLAALHGLSQTLLAATMPGVPDIYQGTEFWDLSLVDPDNRRPPDWAARAASLAGLGPATRVTDLLDQWRDGRVKQAVLHEALRLRAERPKLFAEGDYAPVEASGARADRLIAFQRRCGEDRVLVATPRLAGLLLPEGARVPAIPAEAWGDTALSVAGPPGPWRERFSGRVFLPKGDGTVAVADLFDRFPLALLVAAP